MRIKSFNLFKSGHKDDSKISIEEFCNRYYIKDYTVNADGLIDVNGSVDLAIQEIKIEKLPVKFGKVTGYFGTHMIGLTSLEGCPQWVGGDFPCHGNKLKTLKYLPTHIGGNFNFKDNQIYSFDGVYVENIKGEILCEGNPIYEIYKLNPTKYFIEMINEYGAIVKGEPKIIKSRFVQALEDSGCETIPKEFKFKNYKVVDHF